MWGALGVLHGERWVGFYLAEGGRWAPPSLLGDLEVYLLERTSFGAGFQRAAGDEDTCCSTGACRVNFQSLRQNPEDSGQAAGPESCGGNISKPVFLVFPISAGVPLLERCTETKGK